MDAKSKAKFINSVAGGQKIPCPVCSSLNEPDSMFCFSCGNKLLSSDSTFQDAETIICPLCNEPNEAGSIFCASCGAKLAAEDNEASRQAFRTIEQETEKTEEARPAAQPEPVSAKQAFQAVVPVVAEEPEEMSVFAQGLPAWDIVPPQVMVRRKKKK